MEHRNDIKALFIIANAGFADEVLEITRDEGARGATILNARGEGTCPEMFMGITVDAEKEMILCLTDERTAEKIMVAIKEKAGIATPIHGVCFMMPVDKTVGISLPASS